MSSLYQCTLLDNRETAYGVSVPSAHNYMKTHHVQGMASPGDLNLHRDCTHLILYNVQSHTMVQIWWELEVCLGDLSGSIAKIKHVSGMNHNPHADVWVRKDLGSSLLSTICDWTKIHMMNWGTLAASASRENDVATSHNPNEDEKMSGINPVWVDSATQWWQTLCTRTRLEACPMATLEGKVNETL